jgi:transposase-like protein
MSTLNSFPHCECPYCGNEWTLDDYGVINEGCEISCPKCHQEIDVVCIDYEIWATLEKKDE